MLEVVAAVSQMFKMSKSTNLHCVLIDCREKVVYEEDTESGTHPSKGLNPVVKQ